MEVDEIWVESRSSEDTRPVSLLFHPFSFLLHFNLSLCPSSPDSPFPSLRLLLSASRFILLTILIPFLPSLAFLKNKSNYVWGRNLISKEQENEIAPFPRGSLELLCFNEINGPEETGVWRSGDGFIVSGFSLPLFGLCSSRG